MSEQDDEIAGYLRERCDACGHRLAFAATACPQCREPFDGRKAPKTWPDRCACKRCESARKERQ
jgi:hypothetical protein